MRVADAVPVGSGPVAMDGTAVGKGAARVAAGARMNGPADSAGRPGGSEPAGGNEREGAATMDHVLEHLRDRRTERAPGGPAEPSARVGRDDRRGAAGRDAGQTVLPFVAGPRRPRQAGRGRGGEAPARPAATGRRAAFDAPRGDGRGARTRRGSQAVPPTSRHAGALLRQAQEGLAEARTLEDPLRRYPAAYLSALRAAAAVLALRARPQPRRGATRNVWDLLAGVAPELGEWASFFASCSATRAAAEVGIARLVSRRDADDLLRQSEQFVALVAAGVPIR
ncbi:SAV_6107 family HEPN domain-containing protein [Pseudonocardia sp. N23]|uniref:SAV_6107 family HEPN domain-containing protein n=1 Tax=Pseudonocardia sp. N23 TaxID=1987376 RepID=UPI00209C2738|nr:SAV_6107 family HEPN domain-containing protein [Pseudonocardia sp. N23]